MKYQSCQLLRRQFQALQKVEGLSLRGWSESVELSPAYVSLVLNSKRLPNLVTLKRLGEYLDMDKLALNQLVEAYQEDWLKKNNIRATVIRKTRPQQKMHDDVEVPLMEGADLYRSWLNMGIAEFTLCEGFTEDPLRLARLFEVTPQDVRQSLHWLISSGYLVRDEHGLLKKKFAKVRFPVTQRSRKVMRGFHKQMMLRAIRHMESHVEQEAFARRLINGYTISVNPEKIEKAQVMLQKAMLEIAQMLSEGECTEVYQLQVQFFPLTGRETGRKSG